MTDQANQPMFIASSFTQSPIPIYTIGYGERTVAALVAVLQAQCRQLFAESFCGQAVLHHQRLYHSASGVDSACRHGCEPHIDATTGKFFRNAAAGR